MVLGSLALLIWWGSLSPQLNEAAALQMAKDFARLVEFGDRELSSSMPHSWILDEASTNARQYSFHFRTFEIDISREESPKIGYVDFRSDRRDSATITTAIHPEELTNMARRFLHAAGYNQPFDLYEVQNQGPEIRQTDLWFLPTSGSIAYCADTALARVSINSYSGRLTALGCSLYNPPELPASLTPALELIVGTVTLRAHIFALNPELEGLYDFREIRLGLWVPQAPVGHRVVSGLTPAQIQAGKENRAMLVYWGTLLNGPTEEESNRSFRVYIDAHTGKLLSYWEGLKSGGFGGEKAKRRAPFAWDIGPATLTLSCGKKSRSVPQARIERVGAKTFSPTQKDLAITLGRFTFRADYDAKQGLLRHKSPNGATYGRPDAVTQGALDALPVNRS